MGKHILTMSIHLNTSQLLSNSCCACRDAHHFTCVLTQPSTASSIGHGWATVQSVQTLRPCCSTMGQTCQSRISRQAHEPNCVQTGLALMLFQAALPSLVPAVTAVTLRVLVDVHAAWYMLLSMRNAATNCLLAINSVTCHGSARTVCCLLLCFSFTATEHATCMFVLFTT